MTASPDSDDDGDDVELDDTTIDMLVNGYDVPGMAPLAQYVRELRSMADRPIAPSPELARRMAEADFPTAHRRGGMSARRKAVIGAGVAALIGAAATSAGALPASVERGFQDAIESITPITFPQPYDRTGKPPDDRSDKSGDRIRDEGGHAEEAPPARDVGDRRGHQVNGNGQSKGDGPNEGDTKRKGRGEGHGRHGDVGPPGQARDRDKPDPPGKSRDPEFRRH